MADGGFGEAFDGDHLGLGFQQDAADLAAHFLVPILGVVASAFPMLGNAVLPSFAVTGFVGDVTLVLASALALLPGSRMVRMLSVVADDVVLAATVCSQYVLGDLDVQFFQRRGLWHGHSYVQAAMPTVQGCSWSVILDRSEPYGADVQPLQRVGATQPDRESALATGESLAVIADVEKPAVWDGRAEQAVFAGTVCQRTAVGTYNAVLGFLAGGDGLQDALQAFLEGLAHAVVGFPRFLGTMLVNVVLSVGFLPVGLPPGGDALVERVGAVFATALGRFGFAVEDVDGVVVSFVLLGNVVADGPAVGGVVAQSEFHRADGNQ